MRSINKKKIIAIACGRFHSLALKGDGTVWAWGDNRMGQLGDGTTVDRLTPAQVVGLENVQSIAAGTYFTVAMKPDGTVWSFGSNDYGQLGDEKTGRRVRPTEVFPGKP